VLEQTLNPVYGCAGTYINHDTGAYDKDMHPNLYGLEHLH